jgi:hypothetical protein
MHAHSLDLLTEYVQARLERPYLASYQGDWVTAEILKQVLKNRRYARRRTAREADSALINCHRVHQAGSVE